MSFPIYQIDAFTNRVFGGNPAAVVILDEWLEDETLQAIAAENNLAETAFVIPGAKCSELRWFTPVVEVELCGHATLAAAYVLFQEYFRAESHLRFETKSGCLAVSRKENFLFLDFPSRPGKAVSVDDSLIEVLGTAPESAFLARDLMVVLESEAQVRSFSPNYHAIQGLDAFALIITARGDEVDFVSRFFAPGAGVPEDPVTGSAHCTLIPYWADRLGKTDLVARQLSSRGGELSCELHGDRVLIGGEVVEYMRGKIL
ncbi:PhzF family phenazine biosynthesis protein [Isoalcanivorax indicus]|uniref:PhzF family phenazine biosynthesis protein n=1 Tax=Isoalcanivorax indicus TaxID=2202653 RepID=UPI000DBA0497|nr:PhzF family phenazine biosynthesis protein [Isoalcanivorax indicus]